MAPLFSEEANRRIIYYMRLHGNDPDRFAKISNEIPRYNARQIANQWKNFLDPYLCTLPLSYKEKIFIMKQTRIRKTPKGGICWKRIIEDLEIKFGRRHSECKVKSFMSSNSAYKQRNITAKSNHQPLEPKVKLNPKFPKPQKMIPIF